MANDEFSKNVIVKLKELKDEFLQCDCTLNYYDRKFTDKKFIDVFEPILIKLFNFIFDKKMLKTLFLERVNFINQNSKTIEKKSDKNVKVKNGELYKSDDDSYFFPLEVSNVFDFILNIHENDTTIKKISSDYNTLFIKDFVDTYCLYYFYAKNHNYLTEEHNINISKIYNYYVSSWYTINEFQEYKVIPTKQIINVIDELVRFVDNNSKSEKMRNKHVFQYNDDSRSGIKSLSINGEKLNLANAEISDFFELYQTNSLKRTNSVAKNFSKVRSAIKEKIGRDIIKCKKGYYSLNKENLTFAGFDK